MATRKRTREQPSRDAKQVSDPLVERIYEWPAIWNDEAALRPYHKFICELRWLLELARAEVGVDMECAMDVWPTPNNYYNRSVDGIYIKCTEHYYDRNDWNKFVGKKLKHKRYRTSVWLQHLATPFGEVQLMGGGSGKEIGKWSMRFLQLLRQHFPLERVDHKLNHLTVSGKQFRCFPGKSQAVLYRIGGWDRLRGGVHPSRQSSDTVYAHTWWTSDRLHQSDVADKLFESITNGAKKFVAKKPDWFIGDASAMVTVRQ